MATYEREYEDDAPDMLMNFSLTERAIYGSSRVANNTEEVLLVSQTIGSTSTTTNYFDNPEILSHTNGYKHFELTNHASTPLSTGLDNVMAVVSDKRTPVITGSEITGYTPELLIAKDYYPFGMEMSGRYDVDLGTEPDDEYRFGFNGQEKDDEVTGQTGSVYTATFWEYDARIGRRWNIDPKCNPSISQYATFSNDPILYSDPLGDTIRINGTSINNSYKVWTLRNGKYYSGSEEYVTGSDQYVDDVINSINSLSASGDEGTRLINSVSSAEQTLEFRYRAGTQAHSAGVIYYDFNLQTKLLDQNGNNIAPNWLIVGHEIAHFEDYILGITPKKIWGYVLDDAYSFSEMYATHVENKLRADVGLPLRTHYGAIKNSNGTSTGVESLINNIGESYFYKVNHTIIIKSNSEYLRNINLNINISYPFKYGRDKSEYKKDIISL